MPWCQLHSGVEDDPKFYKLARCLATSVVTAFGHTAFVWAKAMVLSPDGDFGDWADEDIARIAQWPGDPKQFVASLIESKLMDSDRKLHNWIERYASLRQAKARQGRRERKHIREHYIELEDVTGADGPRTDSGQVEGGARTVSGRGEERRGEERTREEKTGEEVANDGCGLSVEEVGAVRAVAKAYRLHHPRSAKKILVEGAECQLIVQRIREGWAVEDLCHAVDGNHADPWHCGENDRKTAYNSLALIVRDAEHVRKFVEVWEKQRKGGNGKSKPGAITDDLSFWAEGAWKLDTRSAMAEAMFGKAGKPELAATVEVEKHRVSPKEWEGVAMELGVPLTPERVVAGLGLAVTKMRGGTA